MLMAKGESAITELAEDIGQTHPAVSQAVRAMAKKGIVIVEKCSEDARVSKVPLTEKGKAVADNLKPQCTDVSAAVSCLLRSIGSNTWSDIDAIEHELKEKSLLQRVLDKRKMRECKNISLVPYRTEYKSAFKALNVAWIE